MKTEIYAALNRVAMLEVEAQAIREELNRLATPAPAQPGEWRDWPDCLGWWTAMHVPEIRTYTYWTPMLLLRVDETSVTTKSHIDGKMITFERAKHPDRHWLRLPDLPPTRKYETMYNIHL